MINKIEVEEIEKILRERHVNSKAGISNDGILDFCAYNESKIKVLWLLKQEVAGYGLEDKTKGEEIGRDWHQYYPRAIKNDANRGNLSTSKSWGRMAIASYMILHNATFNEAVSISEEVLCNALLSVAVVEVVKEPGESRTSNKTLLKGFEEYKVLNARQIEVYKPDVIIACFPEAGRKIIEWCYELLGGKVDTHKWQYSEKGHSEYVQLPKGLLVWTVHPSAPTKKDKYCNELYQACHSV